MTITDALDDPSLFGPAFRDPETWAAWRAFLATLFGLPLSDTQADPFRQCTGRVSPPASPFTEAWLVCGRRAGKSNVMALVAVFLACFRSYREHLAVGERGTVMVIAADRRQARTVFRYIRGLIGGAPMLARMVERETADAIDLDNRVTLEVATASFRAVRGYTLVAALCDEIAFWPSDDSTSPDYEILDALRPGMGTIPGAMLLTASSPYARRGALWDAFRRYHGNDDAPVLVWRAPTRVMNPAFPQHVIDEAVERDPSAAGAEYLANFRTDVEAFINREAVERCTAPGVVERPPVAGVTYSAFTDPSGGSADSMTLAIGHREGDTAVLDLVREVKPPFSPDTTVKDFVNDLQRYRVREVTGDRYAGEWVREPFRLLGVTYNLSEHPKSEIYKAFLPYVNAGRVDLLDLPRLQSQLIGLERRTGRGGRDSVDHGPAGHDDVANAVAGVLAGAAVRPAMPAPFAITGRMVSVGGPDAPLSPYSRPTSAGSGRSMKYGNPPDWFTRGDRYPPGDPRWKLEKKL